MMNKNAADYYPVRPVEVEVINDLLNVSYVLGQVMNQAYIESYLKKLSKYLITNINSTILEQLARIDIKSVDSSTLVDVSNIEVNASLPKADRIADFIKKVKNPYCYCDNGIIVKISFSGRKSMEECLRNAMEF